MVVMPPRARALTHENDHEHNLLWLASARVRAALYCISVLKCPTAGLLLIAEAQTAAQEVAAECQYYLMRKDRAEGVPGNIALGPLAA